MQVFPAVHLLALPEKNHLMRLDSTNVYLIGEREVLLLDTGLGEPEANELILNALRELGAILRYIVISHSHSDHSGGARAIKEATGAQVAVHAKNAGHLAEEASSLTADILLEHGSILKVGETVVEVVHTPGHSPGDICLFLRNGGVLFTGDTILGRGTVVVDGDMVQYMSSLNRLLEYEARIICPGHGPVVEDAQAKIREIIDHRNMREAQILAELATGAKTPNQLVLDIYYDVDTRLHQAAERNVSGHLLKLVEEGRVKRMNKEGGPVYELAR